MVKIHSVLQALLFLHIIINGGERAFAFFVPNQATQTRTVLRNGPFRSDWSNSLDPNDPYGQKRNEGYGGRGVDSAGTFEKYPSDANRGSHRIDPPRRYDRNEGFNSYQEDSLHDNMQGFKNLPIDPDGSTYQNNYSPNYDAFVDPNNLNRRSDPLSIHKSSLNDNRWSNSLDPHDPHNQRRHEGYGGRVFGDASAAENDKRYRIDPYGVGRQNQRRDYEGHQTHMGEHHNRLDPPISSNGAHDVNGGFADGGRALDSIEPPSEQIMSQKQREGQGEHQNRFRENVWSNSVDPNAPKNNGKQPEAYDNRASSDNINAPRFTSDEPRLNDIDNHYSTSPKAYDFRTRPNSLFGVHQSSLNDNRWANSLDPHDPHNQKRHEGYGGRVFGDASAAENDKRYRIDPYGVDPNNQRRNEGYGGKVSDYGTGSASYTGDSQWSNNIKDARHYPTSTQRYEENRDHNYRSDANHQSNTDRWANSMDPHDPHNERRSEGYGGRVSDYDSSSTENVTSEKRWSKNNMDSPEMNSSSSYDDLSGRDSLSSVHQTPRNDNRWANSLDPNDPQNQRRNEGYGGRTSGDGMDTATFTSDNDGWSNSMNNDNYVTNKQQFDKFRDKDFRHDNNNENEMNDKRWANSMDPHDPHNERRNQGYGGRASDYGGSTESVANDRPRSNNANGYGPSNQQQHGDFRSGDSHSDVRNEDNRWANSIDPHDPSNEKRKEGYGGRDFGDGKAAEGYINDRPWLNNIDAPVPSTENQKELHDNFEKPVNDTSAVEDLESNVSNKRLHTETDVEGGTASHDLSPNRGGAENTTGSVMEFNASDSLGSTNPGKSEEEYKSELVENLENGKNEHEMTEAGEISLSPQNSSLSTGGLEGASGVVGGADDSLSKVNSGISEKEDNIELIEKLEEEQIASAEGEIREGTTQQNPSPNAAEIENTIGGGFGTGDSLGSTKLETSERGHNCSVIEKSEQKKSFSPGTYVGNNENSLYNETDSENNTNVVNLYQNLDSSDSIINDTEAFEADQDAQHQRIESSLNESLKALEALVNLNAKKLEQEQISESTNSNSRSLHSNSTRDIPAFGANSTDKTSLPSSGTSGRNNSTSGRSGKDGVQGFGASSSSGASSPSHSNNSYKSTSGSVGIPGFGAVGDSGASSTSAGTSDRSKSTSGSNGVPEYGSSSGAWTSSSSSDTNDVNKSTSESGDIPGFGAPGAREVSSPSFGTDDSNASTAGGSGVPGYGPPNGAWTPSSSSSTIEKNRSTSGGGGVPGFGPSEASEASSPSSGVNDTTMSSAGGGAPGFGPPNSAWTSSSPSPSDTNDAKKSTSGWASGGVETTGSSEVSSPSLGTTDSNTSTYIGDDAPRFGAAWTPSSSSGTADSPGTTDRTESTSGGGDAPRFGAAWTPSSSVGTTDSSGTIDRNESTSGVVDAPRFGAAWTPSSSSGTAGSYTSTSGGGGVPGFGPPGASEAASPSSGAKDSNTSISGSGGVPGFGPWTPSSSSGATGSNTSPSGGDIVPGVGSPGASGGLSTSSDTIDSNRPASGGSGVPGFGPPSGA